MTVVVGECWRNFVIHGGWLEQTRHCPLPPDTTCYWSALSTGESDVVMLYLYLVTVNTAVMLSGRRREESQMAGCGVVAASHSQA